MTRRLIVLRHAKAEAHDRVDFGRELTDRGSRDAAAFGEHLAARGWLPDHAYVSAATRTRQTWAAVQQASGSTATVGYERSLYDYGVDEALDLLRLAPEDAETVILVGHNPTVAYLAHELCDEGSDPEALAKLRQGYPTCAGATFVADCPWADLAPGRATLVDLTVGRHN
ncbi:MAG: histidine phosphatase family protein [Nocardioidaceae bacterium]